MDLGEATTVAPNMPSAEEIAACRWLPEIELQVYSNNFERTGFQGGLNRFRCHTGGIGKTELDLFTGRTIDVPSGFISGRNDWGIFRKPGALETMREQACTRMERFHLVEDAGHWVQQEQPERVSGLLLEVLQWAETSATGAIAA
jgi:pimeloyl-ACP methyl ester carboxylesterase